ncbi:hypothetical protein KAR48_06425 [bacterium]|nr:hypothetical protein [bacterium]
MNDRRNFLKNIARLGMAGGIIGGTAHLAVRKPTVDKSLHICINEGICSSCKSFSGCGLPQALSAKAAHKSEKTINTDKES